MRGIRAQAAPLLTALSLATVLYACGSSGGGISGTGLVAGPIAGFGSIIVDEIEFDTTNAVVTIEGDPATLDDLRLGMFVVVRGRIDEDRTTGVADRIASDHLLQGPVETVDAGAGTFRAMGHLVITDAVTVFEQADLSTLAPGDLVEVFGFIDADANIRATRVERKDVVDELEVTGTVAALDDVGETLEIGTLTVDFSSAEIENAPAGLSNGQLVEVEAEEPPVGDLLVATGIEVRTDRFEDTGSADIAGIVTSIPFPDEFVLGASQRVLITEATRFEGGVREDLVLNARVDVEGVLNNGILVAEEIEFVGAP